MQREHQWRAPRGVGWTPALASGREGCVRRREPHQTRQEADARLGEDLGPGLWQEARPGPGGTPSGGATGQVHSVDLVSGFLGTGHCSPSGALTRPGLPAGLWVGVSWALGSA